MLLERFLHACPFTVNCDCYGLTFFLGPYVGGETCWHTLAGVPAGLIFEAGKCQEGRCLYRVSLAIQLSTAFRLSATTTIILYNGVPNAFITGVERYFNVPWHRPSSLIEEEQDHPRFPSR